MKRPKIIYLKQRKNESLIISELRSFIQYELKKSIKKEFKNFHLNQILYGSEYIDKKITSKIFGVVPKDL